jgi:hypothetical protein
LTHRNEELFLIISLFCAFLLLGRGVQCIVLAHHRLRVPLWHVSQVGQAGAVLAGIAPAQRAGGGNLGAGTGSGGGVLKGCQDGLDGLRGQILVVVIVNLDHGGVNTSTQAFDLGECEEAIFGGVAGGDSEVFGNGLDNGGTTAAAELAGGL